MLVLAGSELRSRFHHALYVALKRPAAHCLPASTQPDIAFGAKGFSGRFPGGLRSCEGRPLRRGEKGEEEGGASSEQGLEALVSGSVRDTNSGAKALPEHLLFRPFLISQRRRDHHAAARLVGRGDGGSAVGKNGK